MKQCFFLFAIFFVFSIQAMNAGKKKGEHDMVFTKQNAKYYEKNQGSLSIEIKAKELLEIGIVTYEKTDKPEVHGVIRDLRVHASYQDQGYGKALLTAVVKDIRNTPGFREAPIHAIIGRKQVGAAGLFTRAGFKNCEKNPSLYVLHGDLIAEKVSSLSSKVVLKKLIPSSL